MGLMLKMHNGPKPGSMLGQRAWPTTNTTIGKVMQDMVPLRDRSPLLTKQEPVLHRPNCTNP